MSALPTKYLDFKWFAERFFTIRDRHARLIPFRMNTLQNTLHEDFAGKDDILKQRQGGCSTYIVLRMLHAALLRKLFRGVILAHEHRGALELMEIISTALQNLPDELRPALEIDTRQEVKFRGTGSRILAATAKNPDIGRAGSISMLHATEVASWDNPVATLAAIMPSLPTTAEIVRESTPKGAGSYWHQQFILGKAGRSGYRTHFFPWMIEPEYAVEEPNIVEDPDEYDDTGRRIPLAFSKREAQLQLTEAQARWRRRMVRLLGAKFIQEYPEDDTTCFLTSGRCVFDSRHVQRCYEILAALDARSELVKQEIPRLGMQIYKQFTPEMRRYAEFVVGADTAEGLADPMDPTKPGDFCYATVLEKFTGVQVASIHGSWEPYEFAQVLDEVGRKYFPGMDTGPALLGVERNNHGTAVLSELHNHIRYPQLYWHEQFDVRKQRLETKLGWHTNSATRPIMLDQLVKAIHSAHLQVRDLDLLGECLTFVRNEKGRQEAQPGCNDDRIIGTAIAWQMLQKLGCVPIVGTNLP